MAKKKKKNNYVNNLPIEVIREILLRLPARSLWLFRCVSKPWLKLISDPIFAKSHFKLAAAPTHRVLFGEYHTKEGARAYDLDALFRPGHNEIKVPTLIENFPPAYVCRGLLLLDLYPQLIICNPVTGANKRISYPNSIRRMGQRLFNSFLHICGIGYDTPNDDYLVVLGWRDKNRKFHFEFFSLKTNSWNNIEGLSPESGLIAISGGLFLNGAIHWLDSYFSDHILVFDMTERRFSIIPLPEGPNSDMSLNLCGLVALGGCLTVYFRDSDTPRLEIWVMKEYKVRSSWTSCKIRDKDFEPIGSSIGGGDIIGFDHDKEGFSKYSFDGKMLDHFPNQELAYDWCTVYTESLISPQF